MWVKVTANDIKQGAQLSASFCPIALAMKRATGKRNVTVGTHEAGYISHGRQYDTELPDAAQNFIFDFDKGRTVQPLNFQVKFVEIAG